MENKMTAPVSIPVSKLHPFRGHPYKVQDNEEMNALIESIQAQGILSPLIVRPLENTADEYEVVSGHRRLRAAVKAGLETVPAFFMPSTGTPPPSPWWTATCIGNTSCPVRRRLRTSSKWTR